MLDMRFAPFIGGFVMDIKTWNSIPEEFKPEMLAAAVAVGKKIKKDLRHDDQKFIDAMVEHGLTVHEVNTETVALWRNTSREFYPDLRGDFVPADIFDRVVAISDSLRSINSENKSGQ